MPGPTPLCLCIAGPKGSGKSSLTDGLRRRFRLENWIDPDLVAKTMAADLGAPVEDIAQEAFRAARNLRVDYARRRTTFGFETVFSHSSNLDFLQMLRDTCGYRVRVYFVSTTSVEINVARVRNRVARGGHPVPEEKVRARYARTMALLPRLLFEFEQLAIFDNSETHTTNRRSAGRLVASVTMPSTGQPEVSFRPDLPPWARELVSPLVDMDRRQRDAIMSGQAWRMSARDMLRGSRREEATLSEFEIP